MDTARQLPRNTVTSTWADISGRSFLAWRMAAACGGALRDVHQAMTQQNNQSRLLALRQASRLLRKEMYRWVQRGEALDIMLKRLPQPSE